MARPTRQVSAQEVDDLIADVKATATDLRLEEQRTKVVADRLDELAGRLEATLARIGEA